MEQVLRLVFLIVIGVSVEGAPQGVKEVMGNEILETTTESAANGGAVEILPGIFAVSAEEIMPGILAADAKLNLPDCSHPKYLELCKRRCFGVDCLPASLRQSSDITIETRDNQTSQGVSDFFKLIGSTMEKVSKT